MFDSLYFQCYVGIKIILTLNVRHQTQALDRSLLLLENQKKYESLVVGFSSWQVVLKALAPSNCNKLKYFQLHLLKPMTTIYRSATYVIVVPISS